MQRAAPVHHIQDAAQLCHGGASALSPIGVFAPGRTTYTAQIQHHIPAARDVSAIGHWGTGDIEVPITQLTELQALETYLRLAYEA